MLNEPRVVHEDRFVILVQGTPDVHGIFVGNKVLASKMAPKLLLLGQIAWRMEFG